ncbi:hypothetical protein EJJ20_35140 (plasmid) [Pseudomonas poae]|nr:hypothetical protein EJJ20_35140 [Pseudomonas poae]
MLSDSLPEHWEVAVFLRSHRLPHQLKHRRNELGCHGLGKRLQLEVGHLKAPWPDPDECRFSCDKEFLLFEHGLVDGDTNSLDKRIAAPEEIMEENGQSIGTPSTIT